MRGNSLSDYLDHLLISTDLSYTHHSLIVSKLAPTADVALVACVSVSRITCLDVVVGTQAKEGRSQ